MCIRDRDKAMRLGLTVAQVYQQIAARLSTDTTATTLKVGRDTYDVTIVDKTDKMCIRDRWYTMRSPRWMARSS